MIKCQIVLDSVSPDGNRLTTMQLMYPRMIHSEFMTHRVFSRNASSSRAIPVKTMIAQVKENPALPIHWGKNKPGMQATEEVENKEGARLLWLEAAKQAASIAEVMNDMGVHKQVVNRILEPFQYIHVIVTATDWGNFFALRCHPDADPNIQALANAMQQALAESTPVERGEHLPYITEEELATHSFFENCKFSSARCARVSYLLHDGTKPSIEKDVELFYRLAGAQPIHASPLEHCAYVGDFPGVYVRNFKGWVQFRSYWERQIR